MNTGVIEISDTVKDGSILEIIEKNSINLMILINKPSTTPEEKKIMVSTLSENVSEVLELIEKYGGKLEYANEVYKRIENYARDKIDNNLYLTLFPSENQ